MDVLPACLAKSGMGKMAVFVLVTLKQIEPVDGQLSFPVMCPTQEMALKISKESECFSYMPKVKATVFFGGMAIKKTPNWWWQNCQADNITAAYCPLI